MSGVCGSVQAAGALGQHPQGHLLLPTSFLQTPLHYRHGGQGPTVESSTSVVAAARPAASSPRGPTINVSSFGGDHCRPCHQHPQGARRRRLQHRWRPLSEIPTAIPRGPAIDVFNIGGGRCRTCRQQPQGARHQRLQLWWSLLPNLLPTPPRGPPSTSSTSVVAIAGPTTSTPQGATIGVFNFGSGRCQTC
jgi:hypothetical protein